MTEAIRTEGVPRKILLATDLSARCDRALDRAAMLADEWGAELLVLHVIEQPLDAYARVEQRLPSWRRPVDPIRVIEEQVRRDIVSVTTRFKVIVDKGVPADVILRNAEEHGCDLIVTGLARDETLGRFLLGRTVDRLLRRSLLPVLLAKGRVKSPYERIVVATDFSEPSRHALLVTLRLFPKERLTLFHAYDAPLSGMANNPDDARVQYSAIVTRDSTRFLQTSGISAERLARIDPLLEYGDPRELIQRYVRDQRGDLVVLGTHGRSALAHVFIGSMAQGILAALPCDALVVRGPGAGIEMSERQ